MSKGGSVKETEAERANADVAMRSWTDANARWRPATTDYMRRVSGNADSMKKLAEGTVNADTAGAFATTAKDAITSNAARGASVGSSKSLLDASAIDTEQARSRGLAGVSADQAAEDIHQQQVDGLIAVGRGQKAGAVAGFSNLADLSSATARADAQRAADEATAKGEFYGTLAGSAIGAAGKAIKPGSTSNNPLKSWGTSSGPYAGSDSWS